jgi:hypothetical protein
LQGEQTTNTIYIALALLGCWRTRAYTASARAECIVVEQFDWPTQEKCQVLAVLHSLYCTPREIPPSPTYGDTLARPLQHVRHVVCQKVSRV